MHAPVTAGAYHRATRSHPDPLVDQDLAEKRHALELSQLSDDLRRWMAANERVRTQMRGCRMALP